jgi:WD40 repeat protein
VWQSDADAGVWREIARCAADGDNLLGIQAGAGRWVATLSLTSPVRLWDVQGGALRSIADGPEASIAVAFDAQGERMAIASLDGRVRLIDVASGRVLGSTSGEDGLAATALNRDGTLIATSGDALSLYRYSPTAQSPMSRVEVLNGYADRGATLMFSGDGGSLLTIGDGRPVVIETSTRDVVRYGPTSVASAAVQQVAMSPDGTLIVGGGADGSVALWDRRDGHSRGALQFHHGRIRRVVFSPDGARVMTASEDGTTALWTLNPPPVDGESTSFAELLHAGVERSKALTSEMRRALSE